VVSAEFGDVEALIAQCRFSDCQHITEPGCAVKAAMANGTLPVERFEACLKLQAELRMLGVAKQYRSRIRQENLVAAKRRRRFEEKGH
jgi:ribosome biogenesis GTPase